MSKKTLHNHHYTARPYHDTGKFARTLNEAFGPHAEWHVDRRSLSNRLMELAILALLLAAGAVISWAWL